MDRLGVIYYDGLEFDVEMARFGYVRSSNWGAGWNFLLGGFCTTTDRGPKLFPDGLMVYAEAAPLPLDPRADLLAQVVEYSLGYYEEADWGASWFECWMGGHHETWDVRLEFSERQGTRYQVRFAATVAGDRGHLPLRLSAWAEFRPPQDRPTGFALAPRSRIQMNQRRFVEQVGHDP
jgi:hypothetical protein